MVSVRYDGYCETVSPYLLRAQAVARPTEVPKERPQHVEYFGTDGTLRRMTFQHMANKLEFERPAPDVRDTRGELSAKTRTLVDT